MNGELLVCRDKHSTFARGQHLSILKAERPADAEASRALAVPFAAVRVRGILDQKQVMVAGNLRQSAYLSHRTTEVDRNDGPSLRRDGLAHAIGVDIKRPGLDVH